MKHKKSKITKLEEVNDSEVNKKKMKKTVQIKPHPNNLDRKFMKGRRSRQDIISYLKSRANDPLGDTESNKNITSFTSIQTQRPKMEVNFFTVDQNKTSKIKEGRKGSFEQQDKLTIISSHSKSLTP